MVYSKGLKSQGYINLITFVLITLNLYKYIAGNGFGCCCLEQIRNEKRIYPLVKQQGTSQLVAKDSKKSLQEIFLVVFFSLKFLKVVFMGFFILTIFPCVSRFSFP